MKLAASKALVINACPASPNSVIHELSGGIRHRIFNPSLSAKMDKKKTDVVGKVILVSVMLLCTETSALLWFTNIPCAENNNGNASHNSTPKYRKKAN